MKTAAIYVRVSTADQHVESNFTICASLRHNAAMRSCKSIRTAESQGRERDVRGLDALIADARQKKFSVVLVAAFDRVARSVKHFLQSHG